MKVGDVCTRSVIRIRADEPLIEAARRMRRFHVGDLVVTAPDEAHPHPVGMITDRDIVVGLVAMEVTDLAGLTVADVVPKGALVSVGEGEDLSVAIARMREEGVRRLPVLDDRNVLVGIVSLDDAVAQLAEQLVLVAGVAPRQRRNEEDGRP